jgi:hypothetical protein
MRLTLALGLFSLALHAQIISEALSAFPTQTESVEYDNLALLRALPNYDALRQQFSGKPLEHAKAALAKLGIPESEVSELVIGASPGTLYGLLGGTFNGSLAAKVAGKKGILPLRLEDSQMFCPGVGTCLVFFEDDLAAFGTPGELKTMLQARQGFIASLSLNGVLVRLLNNTDSLAPVRGVASGSQLDAALTSELRDKLGTQMAWTQFSSGISVFAYSVTLDARAHVAALLECKSPLSAALLKQMLSMLANLQAIAPASLPFQNLQVSTSDNLIDLKMDTTMPT